jgi:3-oxoacyl-[acyl-carrier protein] reductase
VARLDPQGEALGVADVRIAGFDPARGVVDDPLMSLNGRTAIVTGAGTGIGRATARLLAARGARVVAAGLQPGRLAETVAAIVDAGGSAVAVDADVSDPEAIEMVAARAAEEYGGTDVLVNNAAVYPIGPWHEMDAAEWDAVFATNIRGYYLMARAVRPQMLARGGGAVVNVASVTFFTGNALLLAYVASKGAVIGFTRALAREAGPDDIRANAVAPGAFPTAATEIHADQEGLWRDVLEAQSIKRRGEVEDVARAIAFFASDDSSFVTGQTLLVDGGWMYS